MQKVYTISPFEKKLIFKSENETEVKYVYKTLQDYYLYEKVSVVIEEDELAKFETFDDFLDIPEYNYHFEKILKNKKE